MSDTLHDRIRAEVNIARTEMHDSPSLRPWVVYSDRILDRHQWGIVSYGDDADVVCGCGYITADEDREFCPEVCDLAEAWGVEP